MNARSDIAKAVPAALLAALMLAAPGYILAQEIAPSPADENSRDASYRHEHPHRSPFLRELGQLDLTDAQRQTIHGYLVTAREQASSEFSTLRATRQWFETTAPDSADYETAVMRMADSAADAAREQIQGEAALRAKIYSVLDGKQKSKLASDLASLSADSAPPRWP